MIKIFKSIGFKLLFIAALFTLFVPFVVKAAVIDEPDDNLYHLVKARPDFQRDINVLLRESGLNVKVMEMRIRGLEAITFNKRLVGVSQGLVELSMSLRGDTKLALAAVAHELGHVSSGNVVQEVGVRSRNQERAADYYGQKLLHKSGIGCELSIKLNEELFEAGIGMRPMVHPSTYERIQSAKKNCDSLKRTGRLPNNLYFEKE